MIKHKYTVSIYADYTEGIFGDAFRQLMPELGVTSKRVQVTSILSDNELTKEHQAHILHVYTEGLKKIDLPKKGKIIPIIKYEGTIDSIQENPDEINLLEKF
jgi:hypothetical protein